MSKSKNIFLMFFYFFISILLFFTIDKAATYITDIFLAGSFGFTWLIVHHLFQIVFVLLLMLLPFWSKTFSDWGLNLNNKERTFDILKKFTIGWIICTTIYLIISSWLSGWPYLLNFTFTWKNAAIYLFFETVIVGISEELLFRGLIYGVLHKAFKQRIKLIGFSISLAGIISALIFAFAHIGFQLFPFQITAFSPMQFLMAFGLGIFYAVLLEKTDSLLGPILAHNISDAWLSILMIGIQLITRGP